MQSPENPQGQFSPQQQPQYNYQAPIPSPSGAYETAAATGSSPSGSTGGDPSTLPYTLA